MPSIIINTKYEPSHKSSYSYNISKFEHEGDISFPNFTQAVNWINSGQNTEDICISGAEPLIHPLIDDFLELLRMKKLEEQKITVITDGTHIKEHMDAFLSLRPHVKIKTFGKGILGKEGYQKVVEGIKLLRIKGLETSLSIELYKDIDIKPLLELIEEFAIKNIEIQIPTMRHGKKTEEFFTDLEPILMEVVERAARLGASVNMGCLNMPVCHIVKYLRKIDSLKNGSRVELDILGPCNCLPAIEILPSLHIARCHGMLVDGLLMPIKAFKMPYDARNFFASNIDYIAQLIPSDVRCVKCYDKAVGNCQGGCITFKLNEFFKTQEQLKRIVAIPTRDIDINL